MNRIMGRARILLVLILVLSIGFSCFVGEYLLQSDNWILFPGSPHVYYAGNIGCGVVADRDGYLLLDLTGNRTYAANVTLKSASVHWLGDRQGKISAPALPNYAMQIAGFDPVNGVYTYGGTGGYVSLTLSAKVQIAAAEAMKDYTGTVAVYNYKTGELICAVSTPNYDPDDPPDLSLDTEGIYEGLYVNRFTQSAYTPGSIFKIVTAAAALESDPEILNRTFTCNGIVEYGIDKVTCSESHGTLDLKDALAHSCNCCFAQIADLLGGEVVQRYAEQFRITQSVAFDGITTVSGNLQAQNEAPVLVAWSAIGQHKDLVNPCRFMTFLGAIANDGVEVVPHLVSEISVGTETTYSAPAQQGHRIMSTRTAQILQEYLRNNVENHYGDENFPGFAVCAKSGTAEVGGEKKPNATLAGFVQDEQYPLAFVVFLEDAGYGRALCIPVISRILEAVRAS